MASTGENGQAPLAPALENVKRLKTAEQYTDLVIGCKGEEWKVHKVWVCAQSEFFQKGCSDGLDHSKDMIALHDDDPVTVAALIHFFYNLNYEEFRNAQRNNTIAFDVEMYFIADKYAAPSLRRLAASNFERGASTTWNTAEFSNLIEKVYKHTFSDKENLLKKAIIDVVKPNAKKLLDAANGYERFLEVIGGMAEFSKELLVAIATAPPTATTYKCPTCADTFSLRCHRNKATYPNFCQQKKMELANYWVFYKVQD